ncbi:hypothetical protein E4U40_007447 [Claviceps sp. LM458 group G5]|nr:hypothetical protein E4U40_007447 [Claviceps sp. LM458 group G5]
MCRALVLSTVAAQTPAIGSWSQATTDYPTSQLLTSHLGRPGKFAMQVRTGVAPRLVSHRLVVSYLDKGTASIIIR